MHPRSNLTRFTLQNRVPFAVSAGAFFRESFHFRDVEVNPFARLYYSLFTSTRFHTARSFQAILRPLGFLRPLSASISLSLSLFRQKLSPPGRYEQTNLCFMQLRRARANGTRRASRGKRSSGVPCRE